MFKPKTTITGRLENSSGDWIRTNDLRVMSPTSYHCSTPHQSANYISAFVYRQAKILYYSNNVLFVSLVPDWLSKIEQIYYLTLIYLYYFL